MILTLTKDSPGLGEGVGNHISPTYRKALGLRANNFLATNYFLLLLSVFLFGDAKH
jgi:hypothetical protein